jgi:cytochrome c oxidase accessory protein FixG
MEQNVIHEEDQKFRNELATVTKEGKRKWIYPKKPSGRFYNARTIVSLFLLLVLFVTPFIKINGQPFMLFDIMNRNFILFGIPFGPHDFHLFVLAMIAIIVFIILFTVVFGRVFCGWACPQTIFMEMVFRKIEYWLEGDSKDQVKLKLAPWTGKKIVKKISKQIIFYLIAFIISHTLLAYLIGVDKLLEVVTSPPSENLTGFIALIFFSLVFYWIFSYFREQACTIVCPYGRLQGVLLDQDSIVIAYDYKRGEPRGKLKRNEVRVDNGDCIDCHLCVDVCPTGIDIRDGIQLECVNCTACIDECDHIMDKIKKPRGLIRYASLNGIENKAKFRFTPRMILYSLILIALLGLLSYLLSVRTEYSIAILRTPGLLFQEQPNNTISNLYDVNIVNKSFENKQIQLKLENLEGELKIIGNDIILKPQEIFDGKILVLISKTKLDKMSTPIEIGVYSANNLLTKVNTSFLGPKPEEKKL